MGTNEIPAVVTEAWRGERRRPSPEEWFGVVVDVTVDRPVGSTHPSGGFTYPVNYGFVPGTVAADGDPVDVYVLGVSLPIGKCTGVVRAVVVRADDVEDKLVVCLAGDWDSERVAAAVDFCEQHFDSTVHFA